MSTATEIDVLDVLVVGAGFAGLYQLDRLRTLGYSVKLYEAGSGLGGVWHWNCYPGARTDSWGPIYQFSREDLWRDWDLNELYPSRDSLCAYFDYVAQKLDLRKDIVLNTRVVAAQFDEQRRRWTVQAQHTESDEPIQVLARFVVLCTGFASQPYIPEIDGLASFRGEYHHTARWPQAGLDLGGKRVGVVGTGASGVQIIQASAPLAKHLTVFQRTPVLALPMRQRPLDAQANRELKQNYPKRYAMRGQTFSGFDYDFLEHGAFDVTDDQRTEIYEQLWETGGLLPWLANFNDMFSDADANATFYAFWRDKVRQRINDPAVAEKLAPTKAPHPFGVKRPSLEQNYFEVFNRDNVTLVDVRETPIQRVTPTGVVTEDGIEHPLDVLVFATGFDAITGGITAIDIRGIDGESFADAFKPGVRNVLGVATAGFPNLFYIYGPQSPSAYSNGPTCAELQGDWVVRCLEHLRTGDYTRIEASAEAEKAWVAHVEELAEATLFPVADSWYMGANIPGKKRQALCYAGGLSAYLQECDDAARQGYSGFVLS